MEEQNLTEIYKLSCSKCNTPMAIDNVFCQECGFPKNGTEKDVALFHARNAMQRNEYIDADKKIKSARNVLYVMAGLSFLVGIFYFFIEQDVAVLATYFVLCITYLALGSWTSQKPLAAILLGLLLYLTTIIISAIFEPSSIIKGLFFKVIIIVYLGKGVYSASSIKK